MVNIFSIHQHKHILFTKYRPAYTTMIQFLSEDQRYYNSEVMNNRQHHGGGQGQMVKEVQIHYGLPEAYFGSNTPNDTQYRYMLYATQYSQAYCYKVETEYFRSLRKYCTVNESGCTMGEMYWQTNDMWPGASW